ncbi:ATPase [Clostridium sp. MCC353]|uniref:V0D/AC39 family V-type ATPase subunit n=1 Tax=Clostridium sp. MCC353 TaxID=2592646 RepID=UPI001C00B110|nr:V-type ATPase subunit [Clostridium sp. MCC353]MBT9776193.1 ATPase [Clostridium sp. MCC353]
MGSLLSYSGLTTKVRAMESHFISDAQFHEMSSLETVADAVEFLKKQPAYAAIFSGLEDQELHRGKIEERLVLSKYQDFAKLYRFSNLSQRKFLDLYFMHYEVAILKRCLRSALDHRELDLDLSMFHDFFEKHSNLDLIKLYTSQDMTELIANLNGTPFFDLLTHIENTDSPTLFDYEMQLDLFYFKTMWKIKNKYLSKSEQAILSQCFGAKLDLLNLQWIYRSKKYYELAPADIYALLIPIYHRLKKADIIRLAEADTTEEFYSLLKNTYYGNLSISNLSEYPNLEELYTKVLDRIHKLTRQRNPYSIASLNAYLYFKEQEINKIITIIEGIRYGLEPAEIYSLAARN